MEEKATLKSTTTYQSLAQIITNEGWRLWLLFAVIFASYLISMPKTVILEDDGLFIMSSYFLGIAHPPGYPIHTLIGHLFSQAPIGSIASRIHAMSGFFGALGCVLITLISLQLLRSRFAAYPAALMLAWSPVYWSQSIIAEVYTLNALFFLLILLLLLDAVHYQACHSNDDAQFKKRLSIKISAVAFFYGLSLTNHWPLMILSSSCYLIIAWPLLKEIASCMLAVITFMALGLTPYLWMYAYTPPPPEYSVMGPINNLQDLWFYISRKGYGGIDNSTTAGLIDKAQFSGFFLKESMTQFMPIGIFFALIGLVIQWRLLGKAISLALICGFATTSLVLIGLLNFDFNELKKVIIQVYFVPSYCIIAIWISLGLYKLDQLWYQSPKLAASKQTVLKYSLPTLAILLIITLNAKENYRHFDNWTEQYANALFSSVEDNTVVFTDGDTTAGPLAYYHLIENRRPDIELRNINGILYSNRLLSPKNLNEGIQESVIREYIKTEQRKIIFTEKPRTNFGSKFNGLYYTAKPQYQKNKNSHTPEKEEILAYLLTLSLQAEPLDEWTMLRNREIITNAIPVFIALYTHGSSSQKKIALSFIDRATQSYKGKIILIDSLLALNGNYPKELGEIESLLERAKAQMNLTLDKSSRSNYHILSAIHHRHNNNREREIHALKQSIIEWPHPDNSARELINELNMDASVVHD